MNKRRRSLLFMFFVCAVLPLNVFGEDLKAEVDSAKERKARSEIRVYGEVKAPGRQALEKDAKITLWDVIQRAGGFVLMTRGKVRITRFDENGKKLVFELRAGKQDEHDAKFLIRPGDLVLVISVGM